jgi:hypothetical protein
LRSVRRPTARPQQQLSSARASSPSPFETQGSPRHYYTTQTAGRAALSTLQSANLAAINSKTFGAAPDAVAVMAQPPSGKPVEEEDYE